MTLRDTISNKVIWGKVGVALMVDKMQESEAEVVWTCEEVQG